MRRTPYLIDFEKIVNGQSVDKFDSILVRLSGGGVGIEDVEEFSCLDSSCCWESISWINPGNKAAVCSRIDYRVTLFVVYNQPQRSGRSIC
jgi:hypothetical protein